MFHVERCFVTVLNAISLFLFVFPNFSFIILLLPFLQRWPRTNATRTLCRRFLQRCLRAVGACVGWCGCCVGVFCVTDREGETFLDASTKTFGTKSRAGWLRRQRPDCFYFILLNSFAIFSILFCLSLSNLSFCFNIRNSFSYFILSHVSSLLIIFPL